MREKNKRAIKELESENKALNKILADAMPEPGTESFGLIRIEEKRTTVSYKNWAEELLNDFVPASKYKKGLELKEEHTTKKTWNDYRERSEDDD